MGRPRLESSQPAMTRPRSDRRWGSPPASARGAREFVEAERLGREAVASFDGTDFTDMLATAHADLADVLRLAGRNEEAMSELRKALELYEQKGHLVGAEPGA